MLSKRCFPFYLDFKTFCVFSDYIAKHLADTEKVFLFSWLLFSVGHFTVSAEFVQIKAKFTS